ncbi:ABC transporter ATP-binding protein [Fastidiosipila sanguinis]|uniref:ABC transporter ATP-binding protein n=1 Tax=Fastidiosipila sanguinis TaxID=236753 RepID=A0A2S0KPY8_9FIRM|nr:ABC transporter ATP-binding protein [Fastidiosipila sanguinis]AVM43078.1 ABC transporter ATP-binding protein [Fastidiosipila sanguinis]
MENVVEVRNLVKKYKNLTAVAGLDLDVRKGKILGLLGPNGSGKSTTINCILALLSFDQGSVRIFGEEMSPDKFDIKSKIGVVFQDVGVFEELTVYENIDYFCGLYIRDKEKRKVLLDEVINLVGLNDFVKFYPKQLSGGLLRRLNIACGIAHKPELIILDEPTVAVDPQSRNNILEGIKKLNEEGATIIYTSHYMEEVDLICDDIVILDKGKVIAKGTSTDLKNSIKLSEKISFESDDISDNFIEKIKNLEHVVNVECDGNLYYIDFERGDYNLINLIDLLKQENVKYKSLNSSRPTLNDVFLDLTGKELRD